MDLAAFVLYLPAIAGAGDSHESGFLFCAERTVGKCHHFFALEPEHIRGAIGGKPLLRFPLDGHRLTVPRQAKWAVPGAGVVPQNHFWLQTVDSGRDGNSDTVGGSAAV